MPDVTPDEGRGPNIGGESTGYTRTPIPDPTILTTQALYREVSALRELIEQQVRSAAIRSQEGRDAIKARIDAAIESRDELDTEKDKRITQQFDLVERQRVEQKKDTKDAVDAALTAQKEAVREQTSASERAIQKSETATLKQLDQITLTFKADIDAARRSLDEAKERISDVDRKVETIAARQVGAKEDRSGLYATVAIIATILLLGIAIMGFIAAQNTGV